MNESNLAEAAKALLTACDTSVYTNDYCGLEVSKHDATQVTAAIEALREALEAKPAPTVEPLTCAISYDGKTPYALWDYGDGALLDLEVKRLGGTWSKMALYAAPEARKPYPSYAAEEATRSKQVAHAQVRLTDEQIMGAAFSQRYMDGAQYLITVGRVIEEACAQQWGVTLGPIAVSKGEQG
jgi:hypothetical protein